MGGLDSVAVLMGQHKPDIKANRIGPHDFRYTLGVVEHGAVWAAFHQNQRLAAKLNSGGVRAYGVNQFGYRLLIVFILSEHQHRR